MDISGRDRASNFVVEKSTDSTPDLAFLVDCRSNDPKTPEPGWTLKSWTDTGAGGVLAPGSTLPEIPDVFGLHDWGPASPETIGLAGPAGAMVAGVS